MNAIEIISQDVFDKIRSRFQNLEMGDEDGSVTIDPAAARFFDFDFIQEGINLGRVSISLGDLGSLKIYYSQGITENQDDLAKKTWYSFLKEMRLFAMRRLLRFDTRDIAKSNLDKNDFQQMAATQGPKEKPTMSMNESRWNNRSTKKTSRAVRGTTEVIVRHHEAMDEMYPGARSHPKKIKAIFIQNKDGERFKYPFIHPAGAFAMAQHVDHGGIPHDPAGKAIIRMSEQIAQLQEFGRQVRGPSLHADATGITERAMAKLSELKNRINALGKRSHYEAWMSEFTGENMGEPMMELDAVTMEQYKQAFTQSSFKEEIAQFFPLIHSIMSEADTVDLEDYVGEGEEAYCDSCDRVESKCICDDKVKEDAFSAFEQWAEAVEQGKLSPEQIKELKTAIEELPEGSLQLDTAYNFFNEYGINDEELENAFQQEASRSEELRAEPIEVFKAWSKENYPELAVALGISDTGAEEPAPATEPPAPEAGAEEPAPATEPAVAEEEGESQPETGSVIQEVAKIVKSFYNRDNPNVGPFRGEEGIAIDVEKTISEKFGDQAGKQARELAEKFMEKLTMEWQHRHGQTQAVEPTDGLARLKELVANIKQKVEGIGDQGQGGRDFNKNIMSAETSHQANVTMKHVDASNASDKEKAEIKKASKDIKPGVKGYQDRADALKAAGIPDERGPVSEEFTTIMKLAGLAK